MITKPEVIPMLVLASPSFLAAVEKHQGFYEEEIFYTLLGDFARHLLHLHREGHTDQFPAVAEVIERLHVQGDDYVKEAATIGVLEGNQTVWANEGAEPEDFCRYLLPESRRWWEELKSFWRGERHFVGEGLRKQMTAEDIAQVREDIRAFNERLRQGREGKKA